ncbi:Nephrocystin-3 [Talaromyces pinophilus]|nr:Nephrocystin-3 [Talaromyces pinophilus]
MAPAEYNATFSGPHNHGVQAGYIAGNVNYYSAERPETPSYPSLSIPFLRDPDFVDHGTILDQLHSRCAAPGSRTALVGLGGVGKSQLAIQYAYEAHERLSETWIFWIHASNAARFEQSYREIADTTKLFGRQDPKANIFKLVHDWLRDSKNGKWVLVLDNVDDAHFLIDRPDSTQAQASHENGGADPPLREYLPQSPNGSILITSRSREAALKLVDQRDIIVVEPMDEAHARVLFNKKLGKQDEKQDKDQDITELAAALEFIPLAMVQAAAYISDPDRGCSVRQYLNEFYKSDHKKFHLLDHEEGQFRRDWEAKNSVLTTWQISFDSIRKNRRSAADLLSLMSFFDRQGIPEILLRDHGRQGNTELNESDDADDSQSESSIVDGFQDDILILRRYFLISINVDRTTFNMHSLVQLATRRWLEVNGELEKWNGQYIQNLNAQFPIGEYENWAQCQVLFPHVKSAALQRPQKRDSLLEWATVLYKAAWYDWLKGNGAKGEQLSVKSMKARKKLLGLEHKETLASMQMVGSIYLIKGRWKEAEELFVQVMEMRERVLGAEHPDTLSSMNNLALTYRDQGRWKEAEKLNVQVMEICKRVLGVEHYDTLISMNNLASTYMIQGRWKEAEELGVQVMEKRKRALGAEHPAIMASMGILASTYRNQGRWKEAQELFVQVVEVYKRMLGAEHLDTLTSMYNLALTYSDQGRWNEAEELNVQVMETRKRVLGAEHPDTLSSMNYLASIYKEQGRWKEAEELFVQVMAMRERVLGTEHPNTSSSKYNLALTYRDQGRWEEAEELFVQVMQNWKRVLGAEHLDTLKSMYNLAVTYSNQRRWNEAEELFVHVMETMTRVLGVEHPYTLSSMANLAFTLKEQGRRAEAINLLRNCERLQMKILGIRHPDTLTTSMALISWQTERL